MKIAIIGNGYVGKATAQIKEMSKKDISIYIYDKDKRKCSPKGLKLDSSLADECDFFFVCVPTPMEKDGTCHLGIVESVVSELIDLNVDSKKIIVRSTVPVGTCERLGVSFMPEFLTEANWKKDVHENKDWILGFDNSKWIWINGQPSRPQKNEVELNFRELADSCGKDVLFLSTQEAELSKLLRNSFLALKVSFFNEAQNFCDKKGINFDNAREGVALDPRIGGSHSQVPGPDGKKGYGGTCFPKDINSLLYQYKESNISCPILRAAIFRNEQIDRPEQDWKNNKGRASV